MQPKIGSMIGSRLREARISRNLSLNDVASSARISVATLSRIERDKQGVDLVVFLTLCRILNSPPREILGSDNNEEIVSTAVEIAAMKHEERIQLWRELAERRRRPRNERVIKLLSERVEELLAQIEFVRSEIEAVHSRMRRR